ncbi:MAG: amino acid permease [Gemmatimonadetes bacterium]|nr:amino acid permease [Gemmatimonadota bacterium]
MPYGDRPREADSQRDAWGERLPRRLGLLSAIAVLVGSTIGSGIFRTPARIADLVPSPLPMLGVWGLGGLLVLCGALTFAELAALFPRSGGVYVYVREGFGRLPAFLFGWTELLVIRATALGAIATVFAEYLLRSLGYDPAAGLVHYVAAGAIVVTAVFNYVGVRWSAILLNLTTGAKYLALTLLFLLAFVLGQGEMGHYAASDGAVQARLFGLSLVSVLWAYDGWADVSFVSGEVKDPQRNLPRALVIGTVAVIAIYLAVNLAYLYLLPIASVRHSPLVAADAAQLLVGRVGVGLVSVVVMVSTFGTLMGSMLTGPRIIYAMADDDLFFRGLARVHPRFQTPSRSIALIGLLAVVFVLFLGFERLADTFVLAIWPFYALAAATVLVLRHRRPELERPVRTFGYPLVPLLFILSGAMILGNALITSPRDPAIAFGVILSGFPAYWLWVRLRGRAG